MRVRHVQQSAFKEKAVTPTSPRSDVRSSAQSPALSSLGQMIRLVELRRAHRLTESEYQDQRARLLGS